MRIFHPVHLKNGDIVDDFVSTFIPHVAWLCAAKAAPQNAALQHAQSEPPWQCPSSQLGSCTSSGRAWLPRAAQHSQGGPWPLGSRPPPQLLELASKVADPTAFVS